jgi:hypothetical protein
MIPVLAPLAGLIVMFLLIVIIIQVLKWKGVFNDSHQPVFDRLVTELALPAIIFSSLASIQFDAAHIVPSIIIFCAILICAFFTYGICRAFRLPDKTTGTLVIAGAFGSTATFATPLISLLYGPASEAIPLGLAIGTIGVALPFFSIGVLIASYFGSDSSGVRHNAAGTLKQFLTTPIFIAFVLGLAVSILLGTGQIAGSAMYQDVFMGFFGVIKQSLDLLVWIAIGLMLRPVNLRTYLPFLCFIIAVKMILQPMLVLAGAHVAGLGLLPQEILLIEAAMPSGAIAAVLADRYGCDGPLAASIVIGTYIAGLVIIPLVLTLGL